MKRLILFCVAAMLVLPAFAAKKEDLEKRMVKLTTKFDTLQSKADKRIPAETLKKATGIVLLDRTKAGFIFAYQGGGGVGMVKDASGKWSPPVFLSTSEASLGFQIGGQQSFIVIVMMHTNANRMLYDSDFKFGGEASGTAGNESAKAEGNIDDTDKPLYLTYTDTEGLYGGAALKGGGLASDSESNVNYYGQFYTAMDILYGKKVKPSETAQALIKRLDEAAKAK